MATWNEFNVKSAILLELVEKRKFIGYKGSGVLKKCYVEKQFKWHKVEQQIQVNPVHIK